jgi:hypothetical protein
LTCRHRAWGLSLLDQIGLSLSIDHLDHLLTSNSDSVWTEYALENARHLPLLTIQMEDENKLEVFAIH